MPLPRLPRWSGWIFGIGCLLFAALIVVGVQAQPKPVTPPEKVTTVYRTVHDPAPTVTVQAPQDASCEKAALLAEKLAKSTDEYSAHYGEAQQILREAIKAAYNHDTVATSRAAGKLEGLSEKMAKPAVEQNDARSELQVQLRACQNR